MQRLIHNNCCKRPYSMVKMASNIVRFTSSDDGSKKFKCEQTEKLERPMYTPDNPASIDNPPTTCCMSGCPNCVYIEWADALSKEMASADPIIAVKILENVTDPSMKAFLQMELRSLGLIE